MGTAITIDNNGFVYVTGETGSADFPTTYNAYDRNYHGGWCGRIWAEYPCFDTFVAKLNKTGSDLLFATYLGGGSNDVSSAIAVNQVGLAYIAGWTSSQDFPTTANAFDNTYNGGTCHPDPCKDVFVAKIDPAGGSLAYASFLGGSDNEEGNGLVLGNNDIVFVTGSTNYFGFPITSNAFDSSQNGRSDVFVSQLAMGISVPPTPTPVSNSPTGYLGQASCDAISGWAGDKDDPMQPIDVHIYADGSYGTGTFIGAVTADAIRETAVCEALGGSNCGVCPADEPQCKHGFVFTDIPNWLKDGQPHDIYVYGINLPGTSGAGSALLPYF